jgi:hypothetical protein
MSSDSVSPLASVEDAYQSLSKLAMDFVATRVWDVVGVSAQITQGAVTLSDYWLMSNGVRDEQAVGWGNNNVLRSATNAIRFLRDDLLRTTGQRIWGLTFTLYPDGKFNIEYDYNKPEGYEETDEVITGDEINASLNRLNGQDKKPD